MIGKLIPNRLDLTIRQNNEYFAAKCGLCQQLKEEFGPLARFLVNNDALVLQLLIEAQALASPSQQKIRCAVRPVAHDATSHLAASGFAAAVSVLMTVAKIQDAIADARGFFGLATRVCGGILLWLMSGWSRKARTTLKDSGFPPERINALFDQQQKIESSKLTRPAEAAAPTAKGVAELFAHTSVIAGMPRHKDALYEIGHHIGSSLYLLDAAEDYGLDLKLANFNPFRACASRSEEGGPIASRWTETEEAVSRAREATRCALERIDFQRYEAVLSNILTDSLATRVTARNEMERSGIGQLLKMFEFKQLATAEAHADGCCSGDCVDECFENNCPPPICKSGCCS